MGRVRHLIVLLIVLYFIVQVHPDCLVADDVAFCSGLGPTNLQADSAVKVLAVDSDVWFPTADVVRRLFPNVTTVDCRRAGVVCDLPTLHCPCFAFLDCPNPDNRELSLSALGSLSQTGEVVVGVAMMVLGGAIVFCGRRLAAKLARSPDVPGDALDKDVEASNELPPPTTVADDPDTSAILHEAGVLVHMALERAEQAELATKRVDEGTVVDKGAAA